MTADTEVASFEGIVPKVVCWLGHAHTCRGRYHERA
jgi:hypothetical protein